MPLHSLKVGSYGTHHALGLAKFKRARFLLASTSEVYGDPQVHPQPETYWGHVNPVGPRGVYDEAKRYAEALTMAYHSQQGVDTAIVRIFNTYGPRMRPHDGRAIPNFIRQALANEPLTVYGDGSQTRSFCYVDDLIRGLVLLAESGEHLPVNIGNPGEFTILELAQTVLKVTGSTSEIVFEALPVDDPAGAPARHHPRPAGARLGAGDPARGGPAPDAPVVRARAGRCLSRWCVSWRRPSRPPPGSAVPAADARVARACRSASTTRARRSSATRRRSFARVPARCTSASSASTSTGAASSASRSTRPFDGARSARRRLRLVALRPPSSSTRARTG